MPVGTHATRIESPDTAPGFPDVHYTLNGFTGGMELKCNPFPVGEYAFSGNKHGLRKSQKDWIRDEIEAGGRVILVLQAYVLIYFLDGHHYAALEDMKTTEVEKKAVLTWARNGACDTRALGILMMGGKS
jgi:hypothetical protein